MTDEQIETGYALRQKIGALTRDLQRARENVTVMSNIGGYYNLNISPETQSVVQHIVIGHLESELKKARDAIRSL